MTGCGRAKNRALYIAMVSGIAFCREEVLMYPTKCLVNQGLGHAVILQVHKTDVSESGEEVLSGFQSDFLGWALDG